MSREPIIAAAEDYAKRGFSVIPLRPNKKPAAASWKAQQTVRTDPADIAGWFRRAQSTAGVGIILGAISGDLYVRDFDDPESYRRWAAAVGDLATKLPTARTGKGFHVYGRWKGIRTVVLPDGELRGEGAYVAAPPSPHPSGAVYAWVVPLPDGPIPEVDPAAAGLAQSWVESSARATEKTERTEGSETPENTENTDATEDTEDGEAIRGGWSEETRAKIEDAIRRTIPTSFGGRNFQVFKFARALRAIPQLAEIPLARVKILRPVALEWFHRGSKNMLTKDFAVTWGDFVHAWKNVRIPEGEDALGAALEAAEGAAPPAWAADYSPRCQLLAALCRELQHCNGKAPFFLSNDMAGKCVGVDKGTANRYFAAFCADGALEVAMAPTKTRATRYFYRASDL